MDKKIYPTDMAHVVAYLQNAGCTYTALNEDVALLTIPDGTLQERQAKTGRQEMIKMTTPSGCTFGLQYIDYDKLERWLLRVPGVIIKRPTFSELVAELQSNPTRLAKDYGLDVSTIQAMVACRPVSQDAAIDVLSAIGRRLQQPYTLATVRVETA